METFDSPSRVRVLIRHPEAIVAFGLNVTLSQQPYLEVQQGEVQGTAEERFDVVVCDHDIGVALLVPPRPRGAPSGAPRVLVFSAFSSAHRVRQALEAGVHGYVEANCSPDELGHAVRILASGRRYLSASVAQHMAESLTHAALTPREQEVLDCLATGQCNKTIARHLEISVTTVKAHVQAIMGKLDASSRTQAVSIAAQRGLVGLGERPGGRPPTGAIWMRGSALSHAPAAMQG